MKCKKWLSFILAVCLLLAVAGCGEEPGISTGTVGNNGMSGVTESTVPLAQRDPLEYYGMSAEVLPTKPEEPGNSLITYDPEREIVILCENVYRDFYVGVNPNTSFSVFIISKLPLDAENIAVEIPDTQCPYFQSETVFTFDKGTEPEGTVSNSCMPYYLYQVYRGYPFWDANPETEMLRKQLDQILLADFASLRPEDLPVFYLYTCTFVFLTEEITWEWTEESFEQIQITIGDQVYDQQIGRVRILPKSAFPSAYPTRAMLGSGMLLSGQGTAKGYADGISNYLYLNIEASQDMTISNFQLVGIDTEILKLRVRHTSGEYTTSYDWNGTDYIDLMEGDQLYVDVIIRNPLLDELCYDISWICAVDAQLADGSNCCCITEFCYMLGLGNLYELYATVFDGLNMESFYRDYYYPNYEPWRDEFAK